MVAPVRADRPEGCAWITGASSGLGRALALRLARAGWTVAASARRRELLEELASAAEALPGRIVPMPLDVTDREAVHERVAEIECDLGPVALAVLNAGTFTPLSVETFTAEAVRPLVELNVMGVVHGLEALLPAMLERQRGRVAIVASLAGYCGLPTAAGYGLAKAGVINMAEALHPELARRGVILQVINPGFVRTPLTARNDFPMPFLMDVEAATEAAFKGLSRARFEIAFPRLFVALMKLMRLLPYPVFFRLTRRMLRRPA
jgi:short-subunit dehydrogenase